MNRRIRGVLAVLLALTVITGSAIPGLAGKYGGIAAAESDHGTDEPNGGPLPEELLVASPTPMEGNFFADLFGNCTSDRDVRALIHGYNLVNQDQNQSVYVLDPTVVTECMITEDEQGNRTYDLVLAEDLYYSDGTRITAWDYAFSLLLTMAPEMEKIGGKPRRSDHLLGSGPYIRYCRARMEGKQDSELQGDEVSKCLRGVSVPDDYRIRITLDHDFLPYFFEAGLLLCEPYPIRVLAPGCRVYDDGDGVYIGNEDPDTAEPVFTPELLAGTILDEETGYNSHPSVVSGPYRMVSFDGKTARFERNPYFKGAWTREDLLYDDTGTSYIAMLEDHIRKTVDSHGNFIYTLTPQIEKIVFTAGDYDIRTDEDGTRYIGKNSSIHMITEGKMHLVNKVANGMAIMDGHNEPGIRSALYPRIGLSFLAFTCDRPAVHEQDVRTAIAWCMDREKLTEDYCGFTGIVVDGYYGMEQWEYLLLSGMASYPIYMINETDAEDRTAENAAGLPMYTYVRNDEEYEMATAAWDELRADSLGGLVHYGVYNLQNDPQRTQKTGVDKANRLLIQDGWVLNEKGEAYQADTDEVRCKIIDGRLVSLRLQMIYPEGNHIVDTMQENFIDNLNQAGIMLELVPVPMADLLGAFTGRLPHTADMIYLGTNFDTVVDPSIEFSMDDSENHQVWNSVYSDDEELYRLAVELRKTEPGDCYEYVRKWIAFQKRFNEVLPCIPIYSNIYYDFYTSMLQNYTIIHTTWSRAILACWFAEPAEPAEDEYDYETFEDDEFAFDE